MAKQFDKLTERVHNEVIVVMKLGELREELGFDRLGKHVLASLKNELRGAGLVAYPAWVLESETNLQPRQNQEVRIIRQGTQLERIVTAVTEPSTRGDAVLQQAAEGSADLIEQIRDLVCR